MTNAELMYQAERLLNDREEVLHRLLSDNFPIEISNKYEMEYGHNWDFSIKFVWITDGWAPSQEQLKLLWDFGFKSLHIFYNDMTRKWYTNDD